MIISCAIRTFTTSSWRERDSSAERVKEKRIHGRERDVKNKARDVKRWRCDCGSLFRFSRAISWLHKTIGICNRGDIAIGNSILTRQSRRQMCEKVKAYVHLQLFAQANRRRTSWTAIPSRKDKHFYTRIGTRI